MVRQFVPWSDDTIPLSKSGVQMFGKCPYRFNEQMRLGQEAVSPEMEHGREVHATLERLYVDIDQAYIKYMRDIAVLEEEYLAVLPDTIESARLLTIDKSRFEDLKAKNKLSLFFPMLTEEYLVDEEMQYYGTPDRVDKLETGYYAVIDYKSGRFHKWLMTDYRFEMTGYKHLLEINSVIDKPVSHWIMLFLGEEDPIKRIQYHEFHYATITAFYKRVNRVRERIKECIETGIWLKKESRLCDWCPDGVSIKCKMEQEQVV